MSTYGDPLDITPQEALLAEVQRTAGHVAWMRELIAEFGDKASDNEDGDGTGSSALAQWSPALGLAPSVWLQIYTDERKHLVRASEAAIRAGVSERAVKVKEEEARMLAMIFKAFLMNDEMGFTPAQRIAAPNIIRTLMSTDALSLEAQTSAGRIFDADVIEVEETQ